MSSDPNIMAIDLDEGDSVNPEEVEELRPADAMRSVEEAEAAVSEATAALEQARKQKKRAHAVALAVLEAYELDSAKSKVTKRLFYTEEFRDFQIKDEGKFRAWEAEQDENYFETQTKLREQIFKDEMRRRDDDREPLPPGVVKVSFPKLKQKADQKKRS